MKDCESEDDIEKYFHFLNYVYNDIRCRGYKTQEELGNPDRKEVTVYIDRNGEFHKQQGTGHHRLAIARLLKLQYLPVHIQGVHFKWAQKCFSKYGKNLIQAVNRGIIQLDQSCYFR